MVQIVPARKKRIIPFIVILVFLYIIARYDVVFMQPCQVCISGTANSNAKLVYTNSATYITKAEVSGYKLRDGVYTGSLITKPKDKTALDDYNCGTEIHNPDAYDGRAETFDLFMKTVMGSERKESGYYYVMVKDGLPVQSYWSQYKSLLDYEQKLTDDLNSGTASGKVYAGGNLVGGYPVEMTNYNEKTPPYSEELQKLNAEYDLKNGVHNFYVYNVEPLLYSLPVVMVLYILYLPVYYLLNRLSPKRRENKRVVIGLMTEYGKKCSEPVADGDICGVLYTRKDAYHYNIRYDGSNEDIENYLNNHTAYKRAKAYYKLKCEGGIITACDFGYGKWVHKSACR